MIALILVAAVAHAKAGIDLKVELDKDKPESIVLSQKSIAGKDAFVVTYLMGAVKFRERVMPEAMYKSVQSDFPKDALKAASKDALKAALKTEPKTCSTDLIVTASDGIAKPFCTQSWSKSRKAALAKWFTSTRDRLFD